MTVNNSSAPTKLRKKANQDKCRMRFCFLLKLNISYGFKDPNSGGRIAGHELVRLHHAIGAKDDDEVL